MTDFFHITDDPATGVCELTLNRPERMHTSGVRRRRDGARHRRPEGAAAGGVRPAGHARRALNRARPARCCMHADRVKPQWPRDIAVRAARAQYPPWSQQPRWSQL
jgi:hypothetical protein